MVEQPTGMRLTVTALSAGRRASYSLRLPSPDRANDSIAARYYTLAARILYSEYAWRARDHDAGRAGLPDRRSFISPAWSSALICRDRTANLRGWIAIRRRSARFKHRGSRLDLQR